MSKHSLFYTKILILSLCALVPLGVIVPRFLGYGPALITIFGLMVYKPVFGEWPKFSKVFIGWMGAIIALVSLSSLWSINPDFAIERSLKVLLVLASGTVLLSIIHSLKDSYGPFLRKTLPWATILAGFLCVLELYGGGRIYQSLHDLATDYRMNLSHINRSIVVFIFSSLVTLYLVKERKGVVRTILVLIGLVLVGTHSQSSQLAFALAVLTYVAFPYRIKAAWTALKAIIVGGLLGAPLIAQLLFHLLSFFIDDYSWFKHSWAPHRLEIWDFVARRALESPIYGHGVEATRHFLDFDTSRLYHPDTFVLHPHNFALQIWIEFGVIGALLASGFMVYLLHSIQFLKGQGPRMCLPVFVACLSVASTGYGLWQGWWLGLFFLSAALFILVQRQEE